MRKGNGVKLREKELVTSYLFWRFAAFHLISRDCKIFTINLLQLSAKNVPYLCLVLNTQIVERAKRTEHIAFPVTTL